MAPAAGYDPKIIERFADQLLRKADNVRVGCAVGGGIFGVFVGAVPLTPLKSVWGVPPGFGLATIIIGAMLGVLVGYVIGEGRAFRFRVQAQSAIFQLEIERRVSSAVAEAVASVTLQAAPPAAQAPEPVQAPPPPTPALPAALPDEAPALPPLSPVATQPDAVVAEAEAEPPEPVREREPAREPVSPVQPLLRPPGAPAPPVSPKPDEPPLSPAANG
jgi:hypothetical protein